MSSSPFIDLETGAINTGEILSEVVPLAKLIGLFAAIALIPLAFMLLVGGASMIGMLFAILAQFILAVGAGIVLMYVITRAIDLAEE